MAFLSANEADGYRMKVRDKILGHDALSSHSSHSSHPRKPPTSKYSSRSTTFSHSHGKNTPSAPLAQKRDPTGAPAFYKSKHAPLPPLKTSAFDKRGRAGLDRQAVKDYHNVININYRTAPPPPKTKGDTLYFAKAAPSSSSSAGGGVGGRSGYKHPSHLPPMHNDRYARKPLPSAPPPPFLPRHVAQPKLTPYQLGLQDALPPPSPLKPKKQSRAQMAAFKPLGDIGGYKHGSHCSSGYGGAGGRSGWRGR
ncbi:uncharacterized protein KY384_008882 [Bacidia gigantensis]|uniref:uncharacterized protein n=1 Tax=Bacidia gigantensis TaxID=2732470 RepID=UPI001D0403D0|nr:uncharacterized protein KY384_008882 [Bacidia gigantensis]KAG8525238.1 hypothetical protein KY384_008882 [Bacidia gigantensis]